MGGPLHRRSQLRSLSPEGERRTSAPRAAGRGAWRGAAVAVFGAALLWKALEPCLVAQPAPPAQHFGPLRPVSAEAAGGAEGLLLAESAGEGARALPEFLQLRGVLSDEQVATLMSVLSSGDLPYNTDLDSVDGRPTQEYYPLYQGDWQHFYIEASIRQTLEERLLPFVKQRFDCPDCVPCYALVRRYKHRQRRDLGVHHDEHAHVTITFPLNAGSYEGGLFAQREAADDPITRLRRGPPLTRRRVRELQEKGLWPLPLREFLEPELEPGDAVVHRADLLHGVSVTGTGDRYSLIVWIATSLEECEGMVSEEWQPAGA